MHLQISPGKDQISPELRLIELCCEFIYPFEIIRFIEEGSGKSYR
jgi:hypothetical protein